MQPFAISARHATRCSGGSSLRSSRPPAAPFSKPNTGAPWRAGSRSISKPHRLIADRMMEMHAYPGRENLTVLFRDITERLPVGGGAARGPRSCGMACPVPGGEPQSGVAGIGGGHDPLLQSGIGKKRGLGLPRRRAPARPASAACRRGDGNRGGAPAGNPFGRRLLRRYA